MKIRSLLLVLLTSVIACTTVRKTGLQELLVWMKGSFTDDYGIGYTINDSLFIMEGAARYHILHWNEGERYLLAKNASTNKTDKGLYTRIDYMRFTGMEPYVWGYCLIVYNATDTTAAVKAEAANSNNPEKGCNGYPFSRMKRSE